MMSYDASLDLEESDANSWLAKPTDSFHTPSTYGCSSALTPTRTLPWSTFIASSSVWRTSMASLSRYEKTVEVLQTLGEFIREKDGFVSVFVLFTSASARDLQ